MMPPSEAMIEPYYGQPLPPMMPPSEAMSEPYYFEAVPPPEIVLPPVVAQEPESDVPPGFRDGFFQKAIFTHEWLAPSGDSGLGINDLALKTVVELPIPSRKWPLLIGPGFAVHYFEGPVAPELPPRVYDSYVQFRSLGKVNPRLGMEFSVTVGAFGDFHTGRDELLRLTGHAGAMWEWTETLKLIVGASYIDTFDMDVIPIGGVIWTPYPELEIQAVFPEPKISHRVYWFGADTEERQDWLFLAGEFGNDIWGVERVGGADDRVNYRDLKLFAGWERKKTDGLSRRFEVGYVFERELEFESGPTEFEPSDTVMLRTVWTY
jgi:hypothetical protein